MFNRVFLMGRLGNDPQIKKIKGVNLCKFFLTADKYQGKNKMTKWHRINVWGESALICQRCLMKGSLIDVEGEIYSTLVKTINKGKSYKISEINALKIIFLEKFKILGDD